MAYQTVIIRGFEGEPTVGLVIGANEARVSVVGPESLDRFLAGQTAPLMIPREDVFDFDPDLYQRLADLWNHTGQTDLKSWRGLRSWADRAHAEA